MWCVGFFWDAMIFCNGFARWFTKDSSMRMCRVFWDAMIFCNNFARWLPKIVATHVMRCVGFSGMLWSFVTILQDDYKDSSNPCDAMCSGVCHSSPILTNQLFHEFPEIVNLKSWLKWWIREKAGLSKWGKSGTRLMCWVFWDAISVANKKSRSFSPRRKPTSKCSEKSR